MKKLICHIIEKEILARKKIANTKYHTKHCTAVYNTLYHTMYNANILSWGPQKWDKNVFPTKLNSCITKRFGFQGPLLMNKPRKK